MTYLLDVNVLIALVDPRHLFHDTANRWFQATAKASWATCPITENGLLRIVGNPRYQNPIGPPSEIAGLLRLLRQMDGHVFWPDGISLSDKDLVDPAALATIDQITDTYLLALAVHNGGRLATFDRKLSTRAVSNGAPALHLITG